MRNVIHKILSFAYVFRARHLWGHVSTWQMVGEMRGRFLSTLFDVCIGGTSGQAQT